VVHTGHPVSLHRRSLLLRIQSPVTFDFNHEVEQVVIAVAAQRKQSQAKTEWPRSAGMPCLCFVLSSSPTLMSGFVARSWWC
jgi:hypothetical protein